MGMGFDWDCGIWKKQFPGKWDLDPPPPTPPLLNPRKNNGFPFLDILGYLKNTHKNPKFGKVRQIPIREFPTKFPNWDLSHSFKFGIFLGIL